MLTIGVQMNPTVLSQIQRQSFHEGIFDYPHWPLLAALSQYYQYATSMYDLVSAGQSLPLLSLSSGNY